MPQVKIANMKIEAILFDLGKVIIDFQMDAMFQEMCALCSKPAHEFEMVFRHTDLARRYETGLITTREFYEELCEGGGLQMKFDHFCRAWCSIFLKELLISEDLLRELRRRYRLILISNTNEDHARYVVQNYPVLRYFDAKIFSFEVGAMKPDRRIYERAIAVSGSRPETLFFTDNREENVIDAREQIGRAHV